MKVTIKDLLQKRKLIVRPSSMNFGSVYGFNQSTSTFASDLLFVDNCYRYNDDVSYFTYRTVKDIKQAIGVYLNNTFEFTIVEGVETEPLIKEYDKYLLENLKTCLRHYFTVGSDPEIFVDDKNGKNLPAFSFLPGKQKPVVSKVNGLTTAYWDGFQAEFTTAAGTCLDGQVSSLFLGLQTVLDEARKVDPQAKLSHKTLIDVPQEILVSAADEHVQFGCMPSLNIYGLKGSEIPGRDVTFRPAGGHIHFGIGKKTEAEIVQIVKALDAILGVACVSLFASFDDPKRRQLYGLPGEYRLPPHGLEYRTLSNAWMVHPMIAYMVFGLARNAVMFAEQGLLKYWKGSSVETIKVITNCDVNAARDIMQRNKEFYLKMFEGSYAAFTPIKAEALFNVFLNGMESVLQNPNDVVGNWRLDDKDYRERGFNYTHHRVATNADNIVAGKKVA